MPKRAILLASLLCLSAWAGTIQLGWDYNPDTSTTDYILWYGVNSYQYTNSIHCGNTNAFTLTNLSTNEVYFLNLTAMDFLGQESDYTTELVAVASGNGGGVKGKTTNIVVTVSWSLLPDGPWLPIWATTNSVGPTAQFWKTSILVTNQ